MCVVLPRTVRDARVCEEVGHEERSADTQALRRSRCPSDGSRHVHDLIGVDDEDGPELTQEPGLQIGEKFEKWTPKTGDRGGHRLGPQA